jgi:hypothetical protein
MSQDEQQWLEDLLGAEELVASSNRFSFGVPGAFHEPYANVHVPVYM